MGLVPEAPAAQPRVGTASPQSGGEERAGPERPSALPLRLSLQIRHGSGAQAQRCPVGPEEAMGHSCLPMIRRVCGDPCALGPLRGPLCSARLCAPLLACLQTPSAFCLTVGEAGGSRQVVDVRYNAVSVVLFRPARFPSPALRSGVAAPSGPGPARRFPEGPRLAETRKPDSSYSLDYELHREDGPCSGYEHQGVPPLLHRVPVRIRRAYLGTGVKGRFSPHRAPRKSQLPPEIKLQTEELHCLRGELSHIKAQVDRLLEHVELMEQRRDQLPGTEDCEQNRGSRTQGSLCRTTEPRQEPRGPRAHLEADGSQEHTDLEAAGPASASPTGQESGVRPGLSVAGWNPSRRISSRHGPCLERFLKGLSAAPMPPILEPGRWKWRRGSARRARNPALVLLLALAQRLKHMPAM
ncbi:PREDICTED: uncharacterized protein LOC104996566 [Bison bison bison]|uniref:Uncharacterized protein LOC104996566 n=1 Tax=Bison bison bison TaxID=43346 RepID=A0A6P3I3T9_BISBB|nr:PREDICTED: uncharacterized protein LOC104996566 [Bison bison bison]